MEMDSKDHVGSGWKEDNGKDEATDMGLLSQGPGFDGPVSVAL